jgi:Cof subfamily protein (haloacid dehalogenase superfamily)
MESIETPGSAGPGKAGSRPLPDPGRIKALGLDLDGTVLAPGAVLGGRTKAALKGCIARGVRLIICTGRSVEAAEPYRAALGAEGPLVCYNGAEVLEMPGERLLGAFPLDQEIAGFCVDLARELGLYYQIYFPRDPENPREILMADHDAPEAEMYRAHTGMQAVFGDLKQALASRGAAGCIKTMFLTHQAMMDRIRPQIEERCGGRVYITKTFPTFLEVMAAGVSKGRGLRLAMDHLGLDASQVIALGDEENDLPMFGVAGYALAPANAKAQVRQAADRVIPPCAEEGVASFLEDFFG